MTDERPSNLHQDRETDGPTTPRLADADFGLRYDQEVIVDKNGTPRVVKKELGKRATRLPGHIEYGM